MTPIVEENRDSLLRKWHLRYSYATMNTIKQMSKNKVVNDMELTKKGYDADAECLSCIMAKMNQMSFNIHPDRTQEHFNN